MMVRSGSAGDLPRRFRNKFNLSSRNRGPWRTGEATENSHPKPNLTLHCTLKIEKNEDKNRSKNRFSLLFPFPFSLVHSPGPRPHPDVASPDLPADSASWTSGGALDQRLGGESQFPWKHASSAEARGIWARAGVDN